MRVFKFRRHEVELYDSIKDISAEREHAFNSLVMYDLGVGSDMNAIGGHITKLYEFVNGDQKAAALQEIKNLNNNVFMMIDKINVKSMCWSVLVKSIDEETITEFTDEGARKTIKKLSNLGATQEMIETDLADIKKKLTMNLTLSFLINSEEAETRMSLPN